MRNELYMCAPCSKGAVRGDHYTVFGLLKNRPRVRTPREKEESVVFAACAFVTRQMGPEWRCRRARTWSEPETVSPLAALTQSLGAIAEFTDMKIRKTVISPPRG